MSTMAVRVRFPDGELDRWLALGDVTDRSVRAWARGPGAERLTVRLRIDDEVVAEAELAPDPAHDHVGAIVLHLDDSRPDAVFAVAADGVVRSGRLAPAEGRSAGFTFAFGSCHEPFTDGDRDGELERHGGAAIYPAIRERLAALEARFLLLVGDQVYSDGVSGASVREALRHQPGLTDEELLDTYRHLYRGYFNERGFRELAEALPTCMTWDDHDIFDGWGSLQDPDELDRRLYRAAEVAYREYQVLRNPGGSLDASPPFDHRFWHADTGFFVLDLRGCRDYRSGRILGEDQWSRLEAFLEEATARAVPTVFVVASVPIAHFSPAMATALEGLPGLLGTDIRDRWTVRAWRDERRRLLDLLFDWQADGRRRQVAVLSGDVHVGAAFSLRPAERSRRGRLAQWTSSALTTPSGLSHRAVNRLGTAFVRLGEGDVRVRHRGLALRNNVGIVSVEPADGGGHRLSFELHELAPDGTGLRLAARHAIDPGP
jgi:phosphodiesterase/alkaline phosphatase D-like protein